ncbi:MAG: hypothetical protein HY390_03075, partial [Deltaproteobacteria bacterium]|nr:hypothetical protein [Deltaproteobacteria bacterium]
HYSSGMAARLGLSVAIHMDYDILIADEVLSVGDVSFQKKCLERICSDHENGKTILFVSHQHDLIYRLAERVMMIEGGKVQISKNERRASHLKSPEINLSDFE